MISVRFIDFVVRYLSTSNFCQIVAEYGHLLLDYKVKALLCELGCRLFRIPRSQHEEVLFVAFGQFREFSSLIEPREHETLHA